MIAFPIMIMCGSVKFTFVANLIYLNSFRIYAQIENIWVTLIYLKLVSSTTNIFVYVLRSSEQIIRTLKQQKENNSELSVWWLFSTSACTFR